MHFDADTIAKICQGSLLVGDPDSVSTSLTWDSRNASAGSLYAALVGERVDGHDFCLDAARGGSTVFLVSKAPGAQELSELEQAGAAVVSVEDVQAALIELARAWRSELTGHVIALTGSSGKTTTKNLVRDVLAAAGSVVATEGNQNNELGVPATVLAAQRDTDFVVVEMGMRGLGQLSFLCDFVRPDAALVTNVGVGHMELLGSREAIAQAKSEVFSALDPATGTAFANASDEMLDELLAFGRLDERGVRTVFFDGSGADPASFAEHAPDVYAEDIELDDEGCPTFTLRIPGSSARCSLKLAGLHNVSNAVAAAALGAYAGLDAAAIAEALSSSEPSRGRQAVLRAENGARIIDDSYNANPDSMRASLAAFRAMNVEGRRVAVLGDMGELGSFSDEGHALVGADAAASGLDLLVCVGEMARGIASSAQAAGMDPDAIVCVPDAEAVLGQLAGTLEPEDCALVKASRSVGLDVVAEGLVNTNV